MKSLQYFVWFCFPMVFLSACRPDKNTSGIQVTCRECAGKEVSVYHYSLLNQKERLLDSTKFDASGVATLYAEYRDTMRVSIRVNKNDSVNLLRTNTYLEPGSNIRISFEHEKAKYEGDLDVFNNYLENLRPIDIKRWDLVKKHYGTRIHKNSDEKKEDYLSMIRQYGSQFNEKVRAEPKLSNYYKELLYSANSATEIQERLLFDLNQIITQNNAAMEQSDSEPAVDSSNILSPKFFSGLTLNSNLVTLEATFYTERLSWVVNQKLINLINFHYDEMGNNQISLYAYIKKAVMLNPELNRNQEFFMALCFTLNSLLDYIDYKDLLSIVNDYKKDYPGSKYQADLDEILAEFAQLKPGMPSKDFSLSDVSGNKFNLSDLKGKLTYVDVWATWCGPCIEQMHYSKKLARKYAGNKNLTFLYVSVDSDIEAWKKFLKKNPTLKGIHGNQPWIANNPADIRLLYKINGIPGYLLIDKDGSIIDVNALHPSQLMENTSYLDSLLAR